MEMQMKAKTKKILRIFITIALICSIIIGLFAYVLRIDEYIKYNTNVYIPFGIPIKYHSTLVSIDTFDYWIFKLNDRQAKIINDEIENGYWEKMQLFHTLKLSHLDYIEIIQKHSSLQDDCYLCIYDLKTGKVITNSNEQITVDSSNWVVFVFDKTNNYYYCIHETF